MRIGQFAKLSDLIGALMKYVSLAWMLYAGFAWKKFLFLDVHSAGEDYSIFFAPNWI